MATPEAPPPESAGLSAGSYETALCLVPPRHLWPSVDRLRALYDKAYGRWPPHVNLIYPFVRPESLETAAELVRPALAEWWTSEAKEDEQEEDGGSLPIRLDAADAFVRRHENTLFIHDSDNARDAALKSLRAAILGALGARDGKDRYRMHMSVGQTSDAHSDAHKFLLHKVGLLPAVAWRADHLCILARERQQLGDGGSGGAATSRMKLWGTLSLRDGSLSRLDVPEAFYDAGVAAARAAPRRRSAAKKGENEDDEDTNDTDVEAEAATEPDELQSSPSYTFVEDAAGKGTWKPLPPDTTRNHYRRNHYRRNRYVPPPSRLAVASYNVLAEFTWPPSRARYPLLASAILSRAAAADVLVLQEATDDFLSYLLRENAAVAEAYPFASHGPPDQPDVAPLPSLLNTVVLSRWAFDWEWVPFRRPHKGAVVVRFRDIGTWNGAGADRDGKEAAGDDGDDQKGEEEEEVFRPLVLAAIHLTRGLADGAVSNKRVELQRALGYLTARYPGHPCVLAGDFNIATSSAAVRAALERKVLSPQAAGYLAGFEDVLVRAGFVDAWAVAGASSISRYDTKEEEEEEEEEESWLRRQGDDGETFEGEQGATYDPTINALAAEIVGSGFNNRPQRYDRILVRGGGFARVLAFNRFGFPSRPDTAAAAEPRLRFASDHWGVRAVLALEPSEPHPAGAHATAGGAAASDELAKLVAPVYLARARGRLADAAALRDSLVRLRAVPTEEEAAGRRAAFELLRDILTEPLLPGEPRSPLVVVPVGSYGLGVWTPTSDLDCLCIGPLRSDTFFALALQRLRRRSAAARGVRVLRRVRAASGTMLELSLPCGGETNVRADLQYCPATAVAESWPAALDDSYNNPDGENAFFSGLPPQTLAKLKAARDLGYLRRSLPDLAKFRAAHRLVKTWARSRGIYAARFGYLGGVHISILLARVCKLLASSPNPLDGSAAESSRSFAMVSVPDIVATFFAHYAAFDWQRQIAFDPFFFSGHPRRLRYARTAREPLAILGYHPPGLNTAHAASVPSVRVIAEEFRRAGRILARGDVSWDEFLLGRGDVQVPPPPAGAETTAPPTADQLSSRAATDFLSAHRSYARVDVHYWGPSSARAAALVGWLESRCVALLVDLHRRLPGVHARIWPQRFVEAAAVSVVEKEEQAAGGGGEPMDYQCHYLIGIDKTSSSSSSSSDSEHTTAGRKNEEEEEAEHQAALGALQTVLQRFETQIRADARYFDPRCAWVSAGVVSRAELQAGGPLVVDARDWGGYSPGEDESEEEDEDDEDGDQGGEGIPEGYGASSLEGTLARPKKKKTGKGGKKGKAQQPVTTSSASVSATGVTKKLRSAADVIARLRWDPALDSGGFVVGYEDRFAGTREKPLDAWRSDPTDDEFIPQHRVLYFRRREGGDGDGRGAVVWERRTRRDELFGSGGGQ